jgi:hypothetical protein
MYNNQRLDLTARSNDMLVSEALVKNVKINPNNKVQFTNTVTQMRVDRNEALIFETKTDAFQFQLGDMLPAEDASQKSYLRGIINMSPNRLLVKRNTYNLFDLLAIIGGYMFGIYILFWAVMYVYLSYQTLLKIVSSIFHVSVVQEAKAMKQPINIQIKTEISTRKRLKTPSWKEYLVFKALSSYRLFRMAIEKLKKRLDLNKFLRE